MIRINLKNLLEEKNMSQKELAELTGIRRSTICNLCNNNSVYFRIEHIDKICTALSCKADELISS